MHLIGLLRCHVVVQMKCISLERDHLLQMVPDPILRVAMKPVEVNLGHCTHQLVGMMVWGITLLGEFW